MAFYTRQVPSPSPSVLDRGEFERYQRDPAVERSRMMQISSLLNPAVSLSSVTRSLAESSSPPLTPTSPQPFSVATARPAIPITTTPTDNLTQITQDSTLVKHEKMANHINYPVFERGQHAAGLSAAARQELERQHQRFQVSPNSTDAKARKTTFALIAQNTKYIPYLSEKRTFKRKTGRDGFEVFRYFFHVPGNTTEFCVMWDYENGLVRITPFFKACGYSKTVPYKAISANTGLHELSHSITGGVVGSQGYWMPYHCARALCTTFCYDIRYALTPIFGPNFIYDCLRKDAVGFARFKIDPQIVRNAKAEANTWKTTSNTNTSSKRDVPRSVPDEDTRRVSGKELPPRAARPTFKADSPFSSESEATRTAVDADIDSPDVSPKTTYRSPAWNSINRPRAPSTSSYGAWRPASSKGDNHQSSKTRKASINQQSRNKRQRVSSKNTTTDAEYDAERSESESDDEPIVIPATAYKRARGEKDEGTAAKGKGKEVRGGRPENEMPGTTEGLFYYAELLLNLKTEDAHLANGPNGPIR